MGDHRSQPWLQALSGGLLAGLAPAGLGPVLMIPGLALLWSVAERPRLAAVWGAVAVLVSHRWLLSLHPLTWMGVPSLLSLPIAVAIWMVCAASAAVLVGLWSLLARWFGTPVLLLAALWGAAEVLLAAGPLFWIGVGGSTLPLDRPLAGISRWIGAGGLATLQLLWGWAACSLWRRRPGRLRLAGVTIASVLLAHGLGGLLLSGATAGQPISEQALLRLAVWQPAIPTREKFTPERRQQFPAALQRALTEAHDLGAGMLVAPEGTLPVGWTLPDAAPLPLLSGGFRWELGQQRSSLLLLEPGASEPRPLLDKHRLVPLGEWLPPLPLGLTPGLSAVGGLQPGAPSRAMAGMQPAAAAAICYEISDGRALAAASAEGAQWLLAVANLDPYPPLLQRQFTALGQLRALENDRDLLSVANTGPTALITADGQVHPMLPPFQEGVALAELQPRASRTIYARWRDVLLLPLLVVGLVRLVASR